MGEHIDRRTLDAFVEQRLPATERRAVEAHVTTCQRCQSRLAAAKQIPAMLYGLPRARPAPELAARINAAIGDQRQSASARWVPMLVLAMFSAGLGMLALSAPRWGGWVVAAATAQMPNEQAILGWLGSLVADPTFALDALTTFAGRVFTGTAEADLLATLATVLLAAASIAGLVHLLGGEWPWAAKARVQA